jgi:hypothetical protein
MPSSCRSRHDDFAEASWLRILSALPPSGGGRVCPLDSNRSAETARALAPIGRQMTARGIPDSPVGFPGSEWAIPASRRPAAVHGVSTNSGALTDSVPAICRARCRRSRRCGWRRQKSVNMNVRPLTSCSDQSCSFAYSLERRGSGSAIFIKRSYDPAR